MAESLFVRVDEVCQMLAVSRAEAYRIIKRLNAELAAQGYIVMTGRVNRRYLEEHIEFVISCLKENTTKVRNIKQSLHTKLVQAKL